MPLFNTDDILPALSQGVRTLQIRFAQDNWGATLSWGKVLGLGVEEYQPLMDRVVAHILSDDGPSPSMKLQAFLTACETFAAAQKLPMAIKEEGGTTFVTEAFVNHLFNAYLRQVEVFASLEDTVTQRLTQTPTPARGPKP